MQVQLLPGILALLILTGCGGNEVNDAEPEVVKVEAVIPEEDTFAYDTLKGMYIGKFAGSDIRIILNYVSGKNAIGYNIHKGLQRNLKGKVTRSGDSIRIVLSEPGDHEYDGIFTLDFIGDDHAPKGFWVSNSGKIPKRTFTLKKLVFEEPENEGDVNMSNFANIFGYLSDTIGDYQFMDDGLCLFQYYPGEHDYENHLDQFTEVRGSWSLDGKTVTVEWQPNRIFADRKSVFTISRSEWDELTLSRGENDILYNYYYGP